jgi:FkbM family methyltransferase
VELDRVRRRVGAFLLPLAAYVPDFLTENVATRFIEANTRPDGLKLALYDPLSDTLRFPEAVEGTRLWRSGVMADAVHWMRKLDGRLPHGGLVIDVGGYAGVTAQWFSGRAARVIVFEPLPDSAANIREVLRVRGVTNASVHELAISDHIGQAELFVFEHKGHNSLGRVSSSRCVDSVQVRTTTLDAFATEHAIDYIDFLKVDVEGFELEVFKGAVGLLDSARIGTILFESNGPVVESIGKTTAAVHNSSRPTRTSSPTSTVPACARTSSTGPSSQTSLPCRRPRTKRPRGPDSATRRTLAPGAASSPHSMADRLSCCRSARQMSRSGSCGGAT